MLIGKKGKQYGLIKTAPKQQQNRTVAKPIAAFTNDSDDDDDNTVERDILRQGRKKVEDKKVAAMQAAALEQDASVFDYDGVYDSIQEQRVQPKQQEKLTRKSKYIANLLDKAVVRKKEQDISYERQQLRERQLEDHLYGDKEKFVTAAYKRKLEEDKIWQQQQKEKEEAEAREDVTKRGHMGDFYRNLLKSNVAFGGAGGEAAAKSERPKAPPTAAERPSTSPAAAEAAEPEGLAEMAREALQAARGGAAGERATGGGRPRSPEGAAAVATAAAAPPPHQPEHREPLPQDGGKGGEAREGHAEPPADQGAAADAAGRKPVAAKLAADLAGGVRRTTEDKAAAARERYLARKRKAAGA